MAPSAASSLNSSRDGNSTISSDPFQCLTTLCVKKFLLMSNSNLLWCSFYWVSVFSSNVNCNLPLPSEIQYLWESCVLKTSWCKKLAATISAEIWVQTAQVRMWQPRACNAAPVQSSSRCVFLNLLPSCVHLCWTSGDRNQIYTGIPNETLCCFLKQEPSPAFLSTLDFPLLDLTSCIYSV